MEMIFESEAIISCWDVDEAKVIEEKVEFIISLMIFKCEEKVFDDFVLNHPLTDYLILNADIAKEIASI